MYNKYLHINIYSQNHVPYSYGYAIFNKNDGFFYSGDTLNYNKNIDRLLEEKKINRIYHDISLNRNKFHISLDELNDKIKDKSQFDLMHFENVKSQRNSKKVGYNIAPLYLK